MQSSLPLIQDAFKLLVPRRNQCIRFHYTSLSGIKQKFK
jgi:hypothetical protein